MCSSLWFSQESRGIPLARKMCYAVGGVPYQMTTVAMNVSLQIFLLDVVQVKVVLTTGAIFFSLHHPHPPQFLTDGGLLCLHDFIREPGLGRCVRPSHWISGGTQSLDPHWQAHSVVSWWSHMLNTLRLELMRFSSCEPTMFISQAGSFHSVWCHFVSAAVVCTPRLDVADWQRAVVPRSGLPVRDPDECKCHFYPVVEKN